MPSANIFALERNSLDSPRPGVALDPTLRWDLVLLRLFDSRLYQHLIELVKHFLLVAPQTKLLFDLSICGTSFDRIDSFCFEFQGACQHQEAISGDLLWCV